MDGPRCSLSRAVLRSETGAAANFLASEPGAARQGKRWVLRAKESCSALGNPIENGRGKFLALGGQGDSDFTLNCIDGFQGPNGLEATRDA